MDCSDRQKPALVWRAPALPVSARFEDCYYCAADGLAEARHVYLAGNDLPARFRPGFHVAELGFGTGRNALAAALAWTEAGLPGSLRFTSFEAFPMAAADMRRALAAWPQLDRLAVPLVAAWEAGHRRIDLPGLALEVIEGDARDTVPGWHGRADAWFLDGFAPARNPELWQPDLLAHVARHTAPDGTCATYSAAGAVREALAQAGFAVARVPGFGAKRHMTRGRRCAS